MKVLLITPTFQKVTHGPAKFAQTLLQINELFPQHEIRVLTPGIDKSEDKIYKTASNLPPAPWGWLWPITDNFYYYRQAQKIKEIFDFDVLVINNALVGGWSAFKFKEVKVVGMLNDDDYLSATWNKSILSKKGIICIHRKIIERIAVLLLDKVITCSAYLQDYVIEEYNISSEKVKKLYQAVNVKEIQFSRRKRIDSTKPISILFVKSDYQRGGLKTLVEGLIKLQQFQFTLILMGPRFEHLSTIEKYFKLGKNVRLDFRGPTPQSEVFLAMDHSDILCMPSLKEGLGVANIEGLAVGIPVVSTIVGGIPEVLDNGNNGWLCAPNDAQDLARVIRECIESPRERKRRSEKGRRFVEKNFDHHFMLSKFIKLLESENH